MANYTDCNGKDWIIPRLTFGIVRDVKEKTGIDLGKLADQKGVDATALTASPEKFISVLHELTKGSIKDIEDGLDGETVELATYAIIEVVIDFFPNRSLAKTMKARLPAIRTKIDNEIAQKADQAVGKWLDSSLPGSSE